MHRALFRYPTLCAKKEKEVLLVFQHLMVQRHLPGERQSGTAHGNPQSGPLPGHGSSELSAQAVLLHPLSFAAALPWVRQQVKAPGTVLCEWTFFS